MTIISPRAKWINPDGTPTVEFYKLVVQLNGLLGMTVTTMQLFEPLALTTTTAIIYTVPTTPAGILLSGSRVRFVNTTGGALTVTAYAVPFMGTAGVGNEFVSGQSIAANSFLDVDVPVMQAQETLRAKASSGGITMLTLVGELVT